MQKPAVLPQLCPYLFKKVCFLLQPHVVGLREISKRTYEERVADSYRHPITYLFIEPGYISLLLFVLISVSNGGT